MKILSLFDGIACGRLAFERAGIPVEKYYSSEIDKYAIQVAQKNYPDIIQIGDVTKINFADYKDVDIIIGGSPCQDLSIAKQNREGLHGERSRLFWDYVKALSTIKPRYFLLENVASMKKDDRDAITNVLKAIYPETECIMINSALLSAQQRKRYYWTNWHNEQPEDKGILLKDVLESGTGCVVEDYAQKICGTPEKSSTLMARDYKGFGHQRTNGVAVPLSEKSHCIDATYWKGNSLEHFLEKKNRELVAMPVPEATKKGYTEIQEGECVDLTQLNSKTRRGRSMKDKSNCLTAGNIEFYQYVGPVRVGQIGKGGQGDRIYSVRGKSVCLNANGGGRGAKTGLYKVDLPDGDYIVRKLTPIECERLQTLTNTKKYYTIEICEDHQKNCVNAEEENHNVQNAVGSVESVKMKESVLFVEKNSNANIHFQKNVALQNVQVFIGESQLVILYQGDVLLNASFADLLKKFPRQKPIENFALLFVLIDIIKGKEIHNGKVELHQKEIGLTQAKSGNSVVKLSGKEITPLAEYAEKDMIILEKLLNATTSSRLNIKNTERTLKTLFCYVASVIVSFIPKEIQRNCILEIQTETGYTFGISNTQRYKAIGNGWTVDVIAHILKGIK